MQRSDSNVEVRPRKPWVRATAIAVVAVLLVAVVVLTVVYPTRQEAAGVEAVPDSLTEPALPATPDGFDPGAAGFAVLAGDVLVPYKTFALMARPGEPIVLAPQLGTSGNWTVEAAAGTLGKDAADRWQWTPPAAPGRYPVTITDRTSGETLTLNAFVQVPFDHRTDQLNGYLIGDYQAKPLNGNPRFARPEWFVRVTPDVLDARVSPHFTLRQFVGKQASDYPKYLVLDARLLLKLEKLLLAVNEAGIDASTFAVLSGYRTPAYNKAIGNTTSSSRHLYGDAADIYVDDDDDGQMDDLDGDGRITVADAEVLASIVEAERAAPWYAPLVGGLGIYAPAPHRGPFIHVDTRGTPARW